MTPAKTPARIQLDDFRKKMLWRATHRGMKEMDLMLGGYANEHLSTMNDKEIDEFNNILEISDANLHDWITEKTQTPQEFQTPLFDAIKRQSFAPQDYKKL